MYCNGSQKTSHRVKNNSHATRLRLMSYYHFQHCIYLHTVVESVRGGLAWSSAWMNNTKTPRQEASLETPTPSRSMATVLFMVPCIHNKHWSSERFVFHQKIKNKWIKRRKKKRRRRRMFGLVAKESFFPMVRRLYSNCCTTACNVALNIYVPWLDWLKIKMKSF